MAWKLTSLPSTQLLVRAAILGAGIGGAAAGIHCGGDDDAIIAPTCGPCCHGGTGCDAGSDTMDAGPSDAGPVDAGADAEPLAPTCGPCCHGGPGCDGGV